MAIDGTYSGLQASIGEFINRTELLGTFPDWIKLAEAEMNRRIRCADMITSTTLSISTTSTALPSDFNGMVAFELPAGSGAPIQYRKPPEIRALRQSLYSSTGVPLFWTVAGTNLETAPAPGQVYVCTMLYYARIPALTNSNTANWLLTKHPDAYLYGALLQSAPYLKDDPRLAVWGQLYEAAIADVISNDGRVSFGNGMTPPYRGAAVPDGTAPMKAQSALPSPQ